MPKKTLPICSAITKRDGTRCGRRAPEGSLLCHIHRASAEGKPVGPLVEPSPFDPEAKLLKIAAKDGHVHQLQAIRLLMNREKCRACAARAEGDIDFQTFWRNQTDDEKARLQVLVTELNKIKDAVRARIAKKETEQ